jgi:hypothetical protein
MEWIHHRRMIGTRILGVSNPKLKRGGRPSTYDHNSIQSRLGPRLETHRYHCVAGGRLSNPENSAAIQWLEGHDSAYFHRWNRHGNIHAFAGVKPDYLKGSRSGPRLNRRTIREGNRRSPRRYDRGHRANRRIGERWY